jgi:glucose/arabinose dehydrogenase
MAVTTGRSRTIARSAAAAVALVASVAVAACAAAPAGPPGGDPTSTTVSSTVPADVRGAAASTSVGGFTVPWDLRFLPDGTPLVTERPGRIAAVVGGVRKVVATIPDVVALGEGGLMGLELHPNFATNRFIYTCYASGSGGVVADVRVVRFRLSEDLNSLTGATPIVTGIPAGAGNRHLGCRVAAGPDDMLWITTGDAVLPTAPQDPTNRAGKVLRATLGGDPAPGNPGGSWDPYVYTRGHRNPQGLAFRPGDGAAFSVEHGTGCDDEINLLAAGADYGWNPVGTSGSYAEGAPMTGPGGTPAVWSSGCPTIAPSGATFVRGDQWGRFKNQLAVAVLKNRQLMFVTLNGATLVRTDTTLQNTLGRLRTVRNAPDGSLWVVQDANPGSLVRVVPAA